MPHIGSYIAHLDSDFLLLTFMVDNRVFRKSFSLIAGSFTDVTTRTDKSPR